MRIPPHKFSIVGGYANPCGLLPGSQVPSDYRVRVAGTEEFASGNEQIQELFSATAGISLLDSFLAAIVLMIVLIATSAAIQSMMRERGGRMFQNVYFAEDQLDRMSPEERAIAEQLQRLVQVLRQRARERRQSQ
jgi:hypothetical protein